MCVWDTHHRIIELFLLENTSKDHRQEEKGYLFGGTHHRIIESSNYRIVSAGKDLSGPQAGGEEMCVCSLFSCV